MSLSTYMITGDGDEASLVVQVERALRRGVERVQLRRRRSSAKDLDALARRLAGLFPSAGKRVLVNDRLDIALSAGLAGVHLPADGLPLQAVRSSTPRDFLVACSTHTREEAVRAAELGASFIVYGPVFETGSKPGHPGVGVEALAEVVAAVDIPVYALGGMTPERVALVAAAGAAGVAGISAFASGESLEALLNRLQPEGGCR